MGHSGHHGLHRTEAEWAEMAAQLELEAEVMLPYVAETAAWVAERCRQDGLEVRRLLDIGSGPGVAAGELARHFPQASVVAVDGSVPLLERTAARAEAAGLADRITAHRADLPEGLAGLDRADLIWMAMVLHHIDDTLTMLRELRRMLNPGGLLVLVEFGDPMRFLPDTPGVGRPGLPERLAAANAAWIASISDEYATLLEAAGFEVIADRITRVQLAAPLTSEARRVVLGQVSGARELLGEDLDQQDRDALDVLSDQDHPLGVMQRPDVFLDASRHIYVARKVADPAG